jgi:hypothetical protein
MPAEQAEAASDRCANAPTNALWLQNHTSFAYSHVTPPIQVLSLTASPFPLLALSRRKAQQRSTTRLTFDLDNVSAILHAIVCFQAKL